MRFVPIKSIEQQSRLFVHRARQGYVEQRTAVINRMPELKATTTVLAISRTDEDSLLAASMLSTLVAMRAARSGISPRRRSRGKG